MFLENGNFLWSRYFKFKFAIKTFEYDNQKNIENMAKIKSIQTITSVIGFSKKLIIKSTGRELFEAK